MAAAVKGLRKRYHLTQVDLSLKSGVGLRFGRDQKQGKPTLRLDKVCQLLDFFNYEIVAMPKRQQREMRRAAVYYKDVLAGALIESDEGDEFAYSADYLGGAAPSPISLTMPLREKPYKSGILFPFFDGLIPEGWLLDVALRNTDITLDRMSLLLLCCKDCVGAVSVVTLNEGEAAMI